MGEVAIMRLLVTAASRHGSTAEIATELGKALRGALPGVGVDVVPLTRIGGIENYDAVVLGSAVYFGRWLDEARWAVSMRTAELRQRPVWLFSSGPVGVPSVPSTESSDAVELAAAIGARAHVVFPGRGAPRVARRAGATRRARRGRRLPGLAGRPGLGRSHRR